MTTLSFFVALIGRALDRSPAQELDELDDRALADIGVARSELGSIDAESRGMSRLTRLRIVAHQSAL